MAPPDCRFTLSILIVGCNPALRNLSRSLLVQRKILGVRHELRVDVCDAISKVLNAGKGIQHDFIVLTLDLQITEHLEEIKVSLPSLGRQIAMHRVCLLSICDKPRHQLKSLYEDLQELGFGNGLPIIFGDIATKCSYMAGRILKLASATLGLQSGLPTIV